jgi:hypothetical protein
MPMRLKYAITQFCLGQTHAIRATNKQGGHLEQAIKCYQEALRIFTSQHFPAEHQQVSIHMAQAKVAGESNKK